MPGYRGGHISRISLKNFMTYDSMEVIAKPGLNLVIGLNGSGKSSIMCAICLGLAGKPIYTGRSGNLSDFIKYGSEKATVEIELDNPSKKNIVITRIIHGDKSTWLLNKSTVPLSEIQSVVKKFNIDVSNLCQFLPQEKVTEFSKMDKRQRLENMLQAIGEPHLHTLFKELKELKEESSKLEDHIKLLQNNKNSEDQINQRLKVDVDKQEDRHRLKEHLKSLLENKKILIYEKKKLQVEELKKEKGPLKNTLTILNVDVKDMTEELGEKTQSLQETMYNLRVKKIKLQELQEKIAKKESEILQLHEQAHETKVHFNIRIEEKKNQKQKLNEIVRQLQGLELLVSQNRAELPKIEERDRALTQQLERIKDEMSILTSNLAYHNIEKNKLEHNIQRYAAEIEKMKNEENKKMEHLKFRDSDVYEAVVWLQQNKDKFKAPVYEPMFLSLKVVNDDYRKYIENTVAKRDLIAFICEDKEDNKLLTNILRVNKKLKVNIVMVPDNPIEAYRSDSLSRELRSLGIMSFMANIVEAPSAVMRFLCECYKLHKIPLCNSVGIQNMTAILQKYNRFFTPDERISAKRSRYGDRNLCIMKDPIRTNNFLPSSKDHSERLHQLIAKSEAEQNEASILRNTVLELEQKIQNLEKEENSYRDEKRLLLDRKKEIQNIEKQFFLKKNLYEKKKNDLIDEEKEREMTFKILEAINKRKKEIMHELMSILENFINYKKEKLRLNLKARLATKAKYTLQKNLREKEKEKMVIEARLEEILEKISEMKREAIKIYEELKNLLPDNIEQRNERLNRCKSQTIEDVDREISRIQAQLQIDSEENEGVVAEYKERVAKIEDIQKDIDKFEQQLSSIISEMTKKKEQWLPALQTHIKNINAKFSHYYKQLKCAGEISLDTCNNTDDFPKYGLQITLKYRDNEPFMELSNTHHSGGECSVAAIIFILSLQELTEVPFRCIDEINQGMDSQNERNIYNLIAENAKSSSCSQYFLLTPKLLMDLEMIEHKDVAVHIIFNSSFLMMKMNVEKHIQMAIE